MTRSALRCLSALPFAGLAGAIGLGLQGQAHLVRGASLFRHTILFFFVVDRFKYTWTFGLHPSIQLCRLFKAGASGLSTSDGVLVVCLVGPVDGAFHRWKTSDRGAMGPDRTAGLLHPSCDLRRRVWPIDTPRDILDSDPCISMFRNL